MRAPIILGALALLAIATTAHASQRLVTADRARPADALDMVRIACARPDTATCQEAKQLLAHRVANDLMIVASTRDRQHRELARQAADGPYPEVRAAAAAALGAMGPDADDTDTLKRLLNDPVPAVRHPALRALGRSTDPAKRLLLERVKAASQKPDPESLLYEPDAVPDAQRLGATIPPGTTFLHFASNISAGRAAFVTDQPIDAVVRTYSKGQPGLTAEEFDRKLVMGAAMTPETERRMEEAMRKLEELQKSGRLPPEVAAQMQKMQRPSAATVPPQEATKAYRRTDLYGSPRFVLLSKPEDGPAALRYVVVFQDLAVGNTGVVIHGPVPAQR